MQLGLTIDDNEAAKRRKQNILPKAAKCKQSILKKNQKIWSITSRQRQIINKAEELEITTIFVKKLQNTKMSIVQNSKTVYELTNKADIKSHLKHQQKIL